MAASATAQRVLWDSGTCPYAQRAWIALVEKDLPFDHKIVSLQDKPKDFTDLYAEINPDSAASAKVPILVDEDGTRVIESMVVVEYLDDKYPEQGQRLLPQAAADRAKVRLFAQMFGDKLTPSMFALLRADTKAGVAEAADKMGQALEVLDKLLRTHGSQEGGDYFLGGTYSMAETATTPFVKRAVVVLPQVRDYDVMAAIKEKGLDRLESWVKSSLARPSATGTGPSEESMVDGMRKFVVPIKD